MAIVVKHQGNPGIDAVAAYGGGNGKRRAQDRSQASSAMTQEMLQSHAMAQRSHDMQVANAARADAMKPRAERRTGPIPSKSIESTQLSLRNRNYLNGATAAGGNVNPQGIDASSVDPRVAAGLGPQKAANMPDYAKAQMDKNEYDYKEGMDRREFDYKQNAARVAEQAKFTDKQRQEFDQMNQSYEEARKSGDFNESELKEIRRQIAAKQAMIEPLPALPEEAPDTWKQAQSKMFTDPETGKRGFLNKDGIPEYFPDEVDKQKESIAKRYRELADKQVIEQKEVTVGGKKILQPTPRDRTPEEIKEIIDAEQKFMESYLNPDAAAPAGKVVAPNGDTSYVGDTGLAIQKTERLFNSLRGMDGRKLSPEAKAVLNLGEDSFYAAAQEKANARGMSVNDYISIVMKGLTQ